MDTIQWINRFLHPAGQYFEYVCVLVMLRIPAVSRESLWRNSKALDFGFGFGFISFPSSLHW